MIFPLATFAEISKDDENKLTNCTGIYYAYSMIPQGQLSALISNSRLCSQNGRVMRPRQKKRSEQYK